jgi:hypothetical protein
MPLQRVVVVHHSHLSTPSLLRPADLPAVSAILETINALQMEMDLKPVNPYIMG